MKNPMKIGLAFVSTLMLATLAMAADVDGSWKGTLSVTGADTQVVWTFKAEGDKLTGSVSQNGSPELPIKDGKIDGNNISFVLDVDMQGQQFSVNYKGVVSPTEIKLTGDAMGQVFDYVVTKS
jgi:opacity protein-like surface antigen